MPAPTWPREVGPGVFWLSACEGDSVDGRDMHGHWACYLVIGSEKTALIDTSNPAFWPELKDQFVQAIQGRRLDYVVPTHPEGPHVGNLARILDMYPEARVVGDLRNYHLYFPGYVDRFDFLAIGDEIDLGDRALQLTKGVMHDLPN